MREEPVRYLIVSNEGEGRVEGVREHLDELGLEYVVLNKFFNVSLTNTQRKILERNPYIDRILESDKPAVLIQGRDVNEDYNPLDGPVL